MRVRVWLKSETFGIPNMERIPHTKVAFSKDHHHSQVIHLDKVYKSRKAAIKAAEKARDS